MLATSVFPLLLNRWRLGNHAPFSIEKRVGRENVTLALSGAAVAAHIDCATKQFRDALAVGKPMVVDIFSTHHVDARFFGLLLMVRKQLTNRGQTLMLVGASAELRRIFRWNRFEYLLSQEV
jgi:N-acetylglucosaminyldiphosphoundecaprenol N-acetyl-beta-D-mannosaminyltransferase